MQNQIVSVQTEPPTAVRSSPASLSCHPHRIPKGSRGGREPDVTYLTTLSA